MENLRINIRRLTIALLFSLILPMTLVIVVDLSVGSMPILTIAAAMILIPLSTVIVTKATLSELDRVIQLVAPLETDNQELITKS